MGSTESPLISGFISMNRRRMMISNDRHWNSPRFNIFYAGDGDHKYSHDMDNPINFPKLPKTWMHDVSFDNPIQLWPPHSPDFKQMYYDTTPVTSPPAAQNPHRFPEWGAVALGWAGGTLMLALFVLLVRAAEKCLDKKFFKSMRRQSEESQTPVVFVTRNHRSDDSELGFASRAADLDDIFTESITAADLPPAYCDCAPGSKEANDGKNHCTTCEEDPPSYSDVYVPVNPTGRHSAVYIFCRTGAGSRRANNTNNVAVNDNDTAIDMENITENSTTSTLGVPDLVIPVGDTDTNIERVNDVAESKKAEGMVVI